MEYVGDLIFNSLLGIEVKLLPEPTIGQEIHITYAERKIIDEYWIKPIGLLSERGIKSWEVDVFDWKGVKALFKTDEADWDFDIFSAVFYLVSRYEEYLPYQEDKHGRYAHEQSLAWKEGFLNKPLINIWVEAFRKELQNRFPEIEFKERKFEYINTVDVDNAYAYLEKGLVRTFGAYARSFLRFDFKDIKFRTKSILGRMQDPFDNFDWLVNKQKEFGFHSVYFWLIADYDVNDKNVPYTSRRFRSLIKSMNDYASTGIHPSYASNIQPEKLKVELKRLADAIHMPVKKSRQHFLKFKLPDTYRGLIENEIDEDYSMGYPSELGFRASICSPFWFYDLKLERKTGLKIYPFYVMEATLKYYKSIGPEHAMEHFNPIIDEVKKVNGTMISLWHNDSLSNEGEWKGWKDVYEEMLTYIMR